MIHISYIVTDADNVVVQKGRTDKEAFKHVQIPEGCTLHEVPHDKKIALRDRYNPATKRRNKGIEIPVPTFELDEAAKKRIKYPPLHEFAEALTERELGRPEKWDAYIAAVKKVKAGK